LQSFDVKKIPKVSAMALRKIRPAVGSVLTPSEQPAPKQYDQNIDDDDGCAESSANQNVCRCSRAAPEHVPGAQYGDHDSDCNQSG
jgi:hypothetical protein